MSRREFTDVLRIDPHVHSVGSYDCVTPVERILERARTVGLDGVVVTNHDAIERSLRAAERAPNYGLLGIPGVEISTAEGHLLGIGVEESPPPGRPPVETVEEIRTPGGVAVVPHPFQRSKHGAKKCVIEICDGIEVHNAQAMTGFWNRRARAFALARDYPRVGRRERRAVDTNARPTPRSRWYLRNSDSVSNCRGTRAAIGRRTSAYSADSANTERESVAANPSVEHNSTSTLASGGVSGPTHAIASASPSSKYGRSDPPPSGVRYANCPAPSRDYTVSICLDTDLYPQ